MTVADTSFLIDLLEGEKGALRLAETYRQEGWILYAPDIAVYELHRALAQVHRPDKKWQQIKAVLEQCHRLPLDDEAIRIGGQLEGGLKRHGTPLAPQDCMIAGIALRNGMAVLSRNTKDFDRIMGLDVQTY